MNPADSPAADLTPRIAIMELSGREDGKITPITQARVVIGRSGDQLGLDLLYDRWVFRRHPVLAFHDGQWWLEDLGSANGTWLDAANQRITAAVPLAPKQVFRVGHTDLMFVTVQQSAE